MTKLNWNNVFKCTLSHNHSNDNRIELHHKDLFPYLKCESLPYFKLLDNYITSVDQFRSSFVLLTVSRKIYF